MTPLRSVDPRQDADYKDDCEHYRRQLERAIEYAQADAGGSGGSGSPIRDYASAVERLISGAGIRELELGPLAAAVRQGSLGPNIGRNEHEVRVSFSAGRVLKFTKQGVFGHQGGLVKYLERLRICNRFLDDDIRLEGVLRNEQSGGYRIVTSQPYIVGRPATKEEIARYFGEKGFERFTERSWWHGGYEVLFSDAEWHNVVASAEGKIFPIDLIPETGMSPGRTQQIERGVEGWKQQERW